MKRSSVRGTGALAVLLLLMGAVWVGACESGTSPPPATNGNDGPPPAEDGVIDVRLTASLTFEPADLTIEPGTTVRWVNAANMGHTVTPDGHAEWNRAVLTAANQTFSHTFDGVGEFDYFCEPHLTNGMRGSITVEE